MTAVMAIDFLTHILVIADCRISWSGNYQPQDYLQKVYPFGINSLIAFAGDIVTAKAIIMNIQKSAPLRKRPNTNEKIVEDISTWAKEAFKRISKNNNDIIELMFIASGQPEHMQSSNTIIPENYLYKMASPDFSPKRKMNYACLGYAKNYDENILIENRNNLINLGLSNSNRKFQMGITVGSFPKDLAKLANDTVGGLFSVGAITPEGVDWLQYSVGEKYKLEIEDGKFIQYDHENNRRIPLQTVFEFSPEQYKRGNLRLDTPNLE